MNELNIALHLYPEASFKRLTLGYEGRVFLLKVNDKSLVLKFYSQTRAQHYPQILNNQTKLLSLLSDNKIGAPTMYDSHRIYNCLCYLYVEGTQIIPNKDDLKKIIHYLKRLKSLDITKFDFLHKISYNDILRELKNTEQYDTFYNVFLQDELQILNSEIPNETISHGDFHHGNMIWSNNSADLTLIDWDEAIIASNEWDISRFFVSHAIYSGIEEAYYFLSLCREEFCINNEILSFYIHYNAYNCLIRFNKWNNCFWGKNNNMTHQQTRQLLKKIITLKLVL